MTSFITDKLNTALLSHAERYPAESHLWRILTIDKSHYLMCAYHPKELIGIKIDTINGEIRPTPNPVDIKEEKLS